MSGRVLLVDDDDGARISLAALLEDDGHVVVEAATSEEAREALESGDPFHVALLDLHLGDTVGTDLVPDVVSRSPSTRILVLSGDGPGSEVPSVHGWIVKGEDTHRALAIIAEHVRLSRSGA